MVHWHFPKTPPLSVGAVIVFDTNNHLLTTKGLADGYFLPYTDSVHTRLIDAIITIEDKRFYTHHGIDIPAKLSSIWDNISAQRVVRGGSTITEQWIKNYYFPTHSRSIPQKIAESVYAIEEELLHTKETIIGRYVDSLYFGNRLY